MEEWISVYFTVLILSFHSKARYDRNSTTEVLLGNDERIVKSVKLDDFTSYNNIA